MHDGCRVCVIKRDGKPVCFFGFQFAGGLQSKILGWGDVLGSHMTDYAGIVAEPGFRIDPTALLRAAGLTYLLFTHFDETQAEAGLEGEQLDAGLLIDLSQGATAYWEDLLGRDRDFVKDTERRQRQLEKLCGTLQFTWRQPPSPEGVASILARKREQYHRTGVGDAFEADWSREFVTQLAATQSDECAACTAELYAGETWVASHFGLRFRDRLHYWFPVYNPELQRYSPGRLLVKTIIEKSDELGLRIIDRGAGESKAKQDFANGRHQFQRGVWWRPGLRSLAVRAIQARRWRLEESEKRKKAEAEAAAAPTTEG